MFTNEKSGILYYIVYFSIVLLEKEITNLISNILYSTIIFFKKNKLVKKTSWL